MCSSFFFHWDTGRNHKCPNVSFFFLICWTAIRTRRHIFRHMKYLPRTWRCPLPLECPYGSSYFHVRPSSSGACPTTPVSSCPPGLCLHWIPWRIFLLLFHGSPVKEHILRWSSIFGMLVSVCFFVFFSSNLKTLTLNVKSWRTFKVSSWIRPSPKRW